MMHKNNSLLTISLLLVLGSVLNSCGGPLIPSERLVEQYFSTWDMKLVKEVTIRGYGSKEPTATDTKYPAFVPLLEKPGMGVLVLPPMDTDGPSGPRYYGMYWHPESEIRVSGSYGAFEEKSLQKQDNSIQVHFPDNYFSVSEQEPGIKLVLLGNSPILSVLSATNYTTVQHRSIIMDLFSGVTLDNLPPIDPRVSENASVVRVNISSDSGHNLKPWVMGGIEKSAAYFYKTVPAIGANHSSWGITYSTGISEMITSSPPSTALLVSPASTNFMSNGWTNFLGDDLYPAVLIPNYFFESIQTGPKQYSTRRYNPAVIELGTSSRFPRHAIQGTIVLEQDADGNVYLPQRGDKKIATNGLSFLQAYRTSSGELYFLFTQRIQTSEPSVTVRTWSYKY